MSSLINLMTKTVRTGFMLALVLLAGFGCAQERPTDQMAADVSPVDTSPVDTSPVDTSPVDATSVEAPPIQELLRVHKSPTCGCCVDWIDHVAEAGFGSNISHPENINEVKALLGIAPRYQSCHTAVSEQGYVFEGHVPAKLMRKFIEDPPENAIGLAVPGMPAGSPGMEMGDMFSPYKVLMLNKDGGYEVYADITSPDQQY